ncbi:HAD family hydrolase [Streptococcus catagoni]|uniref:HAD family hydrolase n=1 Tax=Streptococcus catagoni TaxID=2654874 RepID=UPI00140CD6CA
MLKAIIFDMDGVITDTEYLDYQLQRDFIKSIASENYQLREEDFLSLVGLSGDDLLRRIKSLSGTSLSLEEIDLSLERLSDQEYNEERIAPLFRKDILDILDFAIENKIKLAVVSSSAMKRIRFVLESCGILSYFNVIVSGEAFEKSKPDPQIYKHSLSELAVKASQVLVVEDSSAGIAAAKGAGLKVIAYEENRMRIDQGQADYILKDMKEIMEKIRELV